MNWKFQEAQNQFSELARNAQNEPQFIRCEDDTTLVVMSEKDYQRFSPPKVKASIVDHLMNMQFQEGEVERINGVLHPISL